MSIPRKQVLKFQPVLPHARLEGAKCEYSSQALLLAIARIILKNGVGGWLEVNALVDQGSNALSRIAF